MPRAKKAEAKPVKKVVGAAFGDAELARIDAYKDRSPHLETRSSTFRYLVRRGLEAAEKEAARG